MTKEQYNIKKDTFENWQKAINFIPKENEVIIYTDTDQQKIGNGIDRLEDLPFINYNSYFVDGNTLVINTFSQKGDKKDGRPF